MYIFVTRFVNSFLGGKPVRVVRNYKLAKHSKFAPKEGNRYDGLYKVVKYFPQVGKSGFIVWRYLLRRDDPAAAPWEKAGRELPMLYPLGYLEAQEAQQQASTGTKDSTSGSSTSPDLNSKSRCDSISSRSDNKENSTQSNNKDSQKETVSKELDTNASVFTGEKPARKSANSSTPQSKYKSNTCLKRKNESEDSAAVQADKKLKTESFKLDSDILEHIEKDGANMKHWDELKNCAEKGKGAFISRLMELFSCIICQEVLLRPVTLPCRHNTCEVKIKSVNFIHTHAHIDLNTRWGVVSFFFRQILND